MEWVTYGNCDENHCAMSQPFQCYIFEHHGYVIYEVWEQIRGVGLEKRLSNKTNSLDTAKQLVKEYLQERTQ